MTRKQQRCYRGSLEGIKYSMAARAEPKMGMHWLLQWLVRRGLLK